MATAEFEQSTGTSSATKTVAIVQSSYIPWKGYFDLIRTADEFVLYDDVQYTRRDWRNRNQIKSPQGLKWLTIPVEVKGRYLQRIRDTVVSDPDWGRSHWQSWRHNYARTRFFADYRELFEAIYLNNPERSLSRINHQFLSAICGVLGIDTPLRWSWEFDLEEGPTERLVGICQKLGATDYLSGPSARAYLDESLFEAAGIRVQYMDYAGYPEYEQLYPPFEHGVSALDLIFNEGPHAARFLDRS